ncbi:MAG TPA: SpoIIE family protein phosphatase [Acidimicrobiales bacterium]|jgi:serine phosphatase RsbU (regulator of sigma subunit)/anti-sigma regulatory factor (Ser/Thr protein kinase)|nr:SpoIIE family protein phosphatase [Acidimicrobiales bacterium]
MQETSAAPLTVEPVALDLLTSAAAAVHGSTDVEAKVTWVLEAVQTATGAPVVAYMDFRRGTSPATTSVGVDATDVERFARPAMRTLLDAGPGYEVVRRSDDLLGDPRYVSFSHRAGLGDGVASLVVPVLAADALPHGVVLLAAPGPRQFDPEAEATVVALASHLGVALDNLETVTRLTELQAAQEEIVHQLQEAVRPPMPEVASAELGVHYLPADPGAPTGGDLYDWLVLPDGDLHLAVVDVMGKGVSATKDAVGVTHALRLLALDGCSLDRLVARAGALVTAQSPELVATVMVARYRPADGTVHLAGGGHPPALLVSGDRRVRLISAPGVAIGWPGAGSSEIVTVVLGRQDTLVLYTDGLIEASKDILAGLDGITAAAAQTAEYPAAHLARALVQRALFGAQRRDDSLALVLRRRTPPATSTGAVLAPFEYRFSPSPATIPLARHLFADWLQYLAVDDAERSDLLLVVSELCSNAVRHASGAPGALALRAWAEGDAVVVEVEDDGAGFELAGRYNDDVPDPSAEQGRGLYVVQALTDDMSVSRHGGHTLVRAVRRAVLPDGS